MSVCFVAYHIMRKMTITECQKRRTLCIKIRQKTVEIISVAREQGNPGEPAGENFSVEAGRYVTNGWVGF